MLAAAGSVLAGRVGITVYPCQEHTLSPQEKGGGYWLGGTLLDFFTLVSELSNPLEFLRCLLETVQRAGPGMGRTAGFGWNLDQRLGFQGPPKVPCTCRIQAGPKTLGPSPGKDLVVPH